MIMIPFLNPLKFDRTNTAGSYPFFDRVPYLQTIEPWEQYTPFCQSWQTTDTVNIQVRSDIIDITFSLYTCSGNLIKSMPFVSLFEDADSPGTFLFEVSMPLNDVQEGCGYFQIGTTQIILQSEPCYIGNNIKNSVLLQYRNDRFKGDIIFETGFSPSLRVPGSIKFKTPASKDTIYEDQILDNVILSSTPYRIWEFILGSSQGIPDYLADKVNRILGCKTVAINGRAFTKATEGGKLEEKTLEDYPMRGWSIDMRERQNKYSNIYIREEVVAAVPNGLIIVTVPNTKAIQVI